jgi:uncharacterized membrane protein YciS (DUF1049 family)
MRLLKWIIVFGVAFSVAWIVIFTFNQEPFTVRVSARIFNYQTPAIAVYWYVAGSLAAGLGLGLLIAAYTSIADGIHLRRARKRILELEQEIQRLQLTASTQQPSQGSINPSAEDQHPKTILTPPEQDGTSGLDREG